MNSGGAELIESGALRAQLIALERTVTARGQETISHPPDDHDDYANACAGCVVLADRLRRPVQEGPKEYETVDQIVHARMWGTANPEPEVRNPYARKGGW
jgi:hypothetical protein